MLPNDDFSFVCVLMEKKRVPDGEGGYNTAWADGMEFTVWKYMETSAEIRIAEQGGFTSIYQGRVQKDFPLSRNDVFRDKETGVTYRVTSDPDDKKAPESSTFDFKCFTAERWALTT